MLLALDPDADFHDRIVGLATESGLTAEPLRATTRAELESVVDEGNVPGAVLIGPNIELDEATAVCAWLLGVLPTAVPLLVALPTTATLRAALRAGFRDVLSPSCTAREFGEALREAGYDERRVDHSRAGLTVAVFSAKGGVGSSVLASNLAIRLAATTAVDCILADLDLTSADQAVLHGARPSWTVQEIADGVVGDDIDAVEQVLLPIPRTGVRLLAGPTDPATAETIDDATVVGVLQRLREIAPLVVVDTSSTFSDVTLSVLERAAVIVLVVSLDVLSLRSLTVTLQTFERLGIQQHRVRIAVMRAGAKVGLSADDVVRVTGGAVDVAIPSSRHVATSVNTGIPLAVDEPRSKVVRAIDELVELVITGATIDGYDETVGRGTRRRRRRRVATAKQTVANPSVTSTPQPVAEPPPEPSVVEQSPKRRRVVRVVQPTNVAAAATPEPPSQQPPPTAGADVADEAGPVDEVLVLDDAEPDGRGLATLPPPQLDTQPVVANGSKRRKRRRSGRS